MSELVKEQEMGEKFYLRTTTAILPVISNKEESVRDLIDPIEMNDSMLDENGRKSVTIFVS